MKLWLRRFAYVLAVLLWLIVMSFPVVAFVLATQQELQIGSDAGTHLRLFLVQEAETEGVGIQWTRPGGQTDNCFQSRLTYLMWEGEGEKATYCQCYDENGNTIFSSPNACDER